MAEAAAGGVERRKHPRFAILLVGEVRPALTGAGVFEVASSNISLGGMVLHSIEGDILQENDVVDLTFPAILAPGPVKLRGRVVWKAKNQYKHLGNWSFGILFYNTLESDIRRILDPAEVACMAGNTYTPEATPSGGA